MIEKEREREIENVQTQMTMTIAGNLFGRIISAVVVWYKIEFFLIFLIFFVFLMLAPRRGALLFSFFLRH